MGLVILFIMILLVFDLKSDEKGGTPEESKTQGVQDSEIQSSRFLQFKQLERA